jgi:hypothetical protein
MVVISAAGGRKPFSRPTTRQCAKRSPLTLTGKEESELED